MKGKKSKKNLEETVFMICPVRGLTKEENKFLQDYISRLESKGYKIHYPPRDTNQNDSIGLHICSENKEAIKKAKEVHIYWNPTSQGSKFDLGMAFMLDKPIVLINKDKIQRTNYKSFENVLLELDAKYRKIKFS